MTTLIEFGYEDVKVIGRGQYGKAHLVRSVELQSPFIAKTVDLTCLSSKERETSLQEVALLRRLDHPNIVKYRDNFFMADTLVIVMQYCEGGDLQAYIKEKLKERQRIREVQIMHYFVQVLQALQYIHGERILHRDLKTSNLFLMKSKQVVKLGDFGISRVLEGSIEAAITVVGTPYYMSPEVCENKPYTFKSDVWALGCVLYELSMLKHAFAADNLLGLVYKIVSDKYEPIPKMYSSALNVLIQRMLEKDAEKRPSVRDLLADPYVHRFMDEYVRTRGQVAASAKGSGRHAADGANPAAASGAPAQAGGAEAPPGQAPPAAAERQPPRARAPRKEERGAAARTGKGAAGSGETRKLETPKEAALRRKREVADRQAAELKVAAKDAEHNKMVAKQMKDSEFQSTRLGHGMAVTSSSQMSPGGGHAETLQDYMDAPPDEASEEDYTDSEDGTEYEDDFVSEDDSEEADASDEVADLGPVGESVREETDFGRVMANYEQDLCRVQDSGPSATPLPLSPMAAPAELPVGPKPGAIMNMQSRAGKLREELVGKMGAETFEKTFSYLLQARQVGTEEKTVRRELEALVGRDTYKRFCFDVDQVVFQQMCYS